jgi:hypothetical protein
MRRPTLWPALGAALLLVGLAAAAPVASAAAAQPSRSAQPALATKVTTPPGTVDPFTGSFPVGFLLCNFKDWTYKPNSLSYYESIWTKQNRAGTYASLPDYFKDESYGQLTMAGSKVLGWYPMAMTTAAYGPSSLGPRWTSCVNAVLAAGVDVTKFKSLITVQPWIRSKVTGGGIGAWLSPADWPAGHAHPNPETFTVASTADWPSAPFYLSLPIGTYGQSTLVTKVKGDTVTVIRGDSGTAQAPQSQLLSVNAGSSVSTVSTDDQAFVGPLTAYLTANGQKCKSGSARCPTISFTDSSGAKAINIGAAGLQAGDLARDGTYTSGVGDSAHEVGHTTGFYHSRVLSSSTTGYRDCYDQMSYDYCGLPQLPSLAGPPDSIVGYSAPNLEFHGWIPADKQFNSKNASIKQTTITLHALSDPNALHDSGYLDAHLPAKVQIEDTAPSHAIPTVPPSNCTAKGYQCEHSSYYTVEYRQKYGFDKELSGNHVGADNASGTIASGAVILNLVVPHPANCGAGGDGGCNNSYLVDSQPGVSSGGGQPAYLPNAGAFEPGTDYADPAHHVYVAVNSFNASARSARVTVSTRPIVTTLTVDVPSQAEAGTTVTLSATLKVGGAPVPDQKVSFTVGTGPACSGQTSLSGAVSCKVTLGSAATLTSVTAKFGGDKAYASKSAAGQTQIWTPDTTVSAPPSAGSANSPSVVWLGSSWFAAWRDATSGVIYWSTDSGSGWSAPVALVIGNTTITTAHAPAVASDGGLPVIAWTTASGTIEFSGFALIAWSPPVTVKGSWGSAETDHGPAFAGTNDHGFIAAWTGKSTKHVFYSECSESACSSGAWQAQQDLSSTTTAYAPAVTAATTGSTFLAYLAWTNSNGTIGLERLDGSTRTALADIPSAKSGNSPGITATTSTRTIIVAWKGASSDRVYYRERIGTTWQPQRDEPQASTTQAPALALDSPTLRLLWSVPSTNTIEEAQTAH